MSDALAWNVRRAREARGWSQADLAARSGVPRATVSRVEAGDANPSFHAVLSLAAALDCSLDELVALPGAGERLVPASELPIRRRGGASLRPLLPEPLPGWLLERIELEPGARHTGAPHAAGSREFLACERGVMVLRTALHRWELKPGDVVAYAGDQAHTYSNPGHEPAVAITVVRLAE